MKREQEPLTQEEISMLEQYYKWQALTFRERKQRLKQMQAAEEQKQKGATNNEP